MGRRRRGLLILGYKRVTLHSDTPRYSGSAVLGGIAFSVGSPPRSVPFRNVCVSFRRGDQATALLAPVAGVAEVAVDGAGGDFGDERQAPLVLRGLDLRENSSDDSLLKASRNEL